MDLKPATSIPSEYVVHSIFAKLWCDQELFKGWIISSPGVSKVSLLSPKKSSGANSVGGNYFWPRPFPNMGKNLTFDRKIVETQFFYQNDCN